MILNLKRCLGIAGLISVAMLPTASGAACAPLLNHSFPGLQEGKTQSLCQYQGKVILVVNTASFCGYTSQYEGLEKLYETYRGQKFAVLGFPANDFAGQEPGTNDEIQSFCSLNYQVQFPLYSKIAVTGPDKHPLYQALIAAQPETEGRASMETMLRGYNIEPTAAPEVVWNFEKFLIGRDGKVARRFAPDTAPDNAVLIAAIEAELARA